MTDHDSYRDELFERKLKVGIRELHRVEQFPNQATSEATAAATTPDPDKLKWAMVAIILSALTVLGGIGWMQRDNSSPARVMSNPEQNPEGGASRAERLVKQLELSTNRTRAVLALVRLGSLSVPPLSRALGDPRPEIATAAARALGFLGWTGRPAVPALVAQTKSENSAVATAARWALGRMEQLNSTLVVNLGATLFEVDSAGKTTFRLDVAGLNDAEALPNGNYLVTVQKIGAMAAAVHEVTPSGKQEWSHPISLSFDADPLPGGNVLVTDWKRDRVYEVNRRGEIEWQYDCRRPLKAERLPNGNTLIAESSKGVIEVDRAGEVVWRYDEKTFHAQRLPSGNTLIVRTSSAPYVFEIDRDGTVVAEMADLEAVNDARRLANGNTLIETKTEVRELDRNGAVVWSFGPIDRVSTAQRR